MRYNTFMSTVNIVLVSDNHGDQDSLAWLKETYSDYDLFVHCGDSEMDAEQMGGYICVKGNNDYLYYSQIPDTMTLHIKGHTVYVCHGHLEPISFYGFKPMVRNAKDIGADTVFFGHVHTVHDTTEDGIRLLNPGSIRQNRDGSPPSYMLVHISEDRIDAEVKEYVRKKTKTDSFLEKLIRFLTKEQ